MIYQAKPDRPLAVDEFMARQDRTDRRAQEWEAHLQEVFKSSPQYGRMTFEQWRRIYHPAEAPLPAIR